MALKSNRLSSTNNSFMVLYGYFFSSCKITARWSAFCDKTTDRSLGLMWITSWRCLCLKIGSLHASSYSVISSSSPPLLFTFDCYWRYKNLLCFRITVKTMLTRFACGLFSFIAECSVSDRCVQYTLVVGRARCCSTRLSGCVQLFRWKVDHFQIDKSRHHDLLDAVWLEVLLAVIGDQFGKYTDDICGIVVNIRNKGSKVYYDDCFSPLAMYLFINWLNFISNWIVQKDFFFKASLFWNPPPLILKVTAGDLRRCRS